jgi:hypothetical protein
MAVHSITSDPKPSSKINGWLYAYYNKPTANGGECTCVFPPAIRDIVKRGFTFDDSILAFDQSLGATVLRLDFSEPAHDGEPQLPPDPETGWADPDPLLAGGAPIAPARAGTRAPATRRREATQLAVNGAQLPPPMLKMGLELSRLFLLQYSLLSSVPESNRALIAQKLAVTVAIPYYRSVGVELSEEEVQAISTV